MPEGRFPFPNREDSIKILKADPCYGKIAPEQVDAVFDRAWKTGEEQAELFLRERIGRTDISMMEILKGLNFEIEIHDMDYVMGNIRYFCEYISQKNIVRIYSQSVSLWAKRNNLPYESGLNLVLAHEYFHYLEWHIIGQTSKQYLVPMVKIGPIKLGKTGIAALSEIGANAFANRYYKYLVKNKKG